MKGGPAIHRLAMAAIEIVDGNHGVAGIEQLLHGVRTDVSRSAGN